MLSIIIYLDRLRFTGSFERQRDTKHLKICRESQKDLHEAYYSDGKITCFEQGLKEIIFHLFSFFVGSTRSSYSQFKARSRSSSDRKRPLKNDSSSQ